jgi:DNA-binding GntR family transcriptional regulator
MSVAPSPYEFLDKPASLARGNVTADVTQSIRQAIVTMALPPGTLLDKGAICERLGVSRFPVSEALARLAAEGLVDILPQRGSMVSRVRIADVREYMLIRKGLESEAVRVLIGALSDQVVEDLHANMALQRAAAARDDAPDFHVHDLAFHDIIFRTMRLSRIKQIIDSARANLDRARRLIITPRRLALTIAEHQVILDNILARDEAAAIRAIRAHIDAVMVELYAFSREEPDHFADGEEHLREGEANSFPFG